MDHLCNTGRVNHQIDTHLPTSFAKLFLSYRNVASFTEDSNVKLCMESHLCTDSNSISSLILGRFHIHLQSPNLGEGSA